MAGRLDSKVALITGAASGIGAATARLFAAEGARLALGDVNEAGLMAVVAEVQQSGGEAFGLSANVSDERQVAGLVQAAVERFGRLDVLFANAGIGGRGGKVTELALEVYEQVMAVNLRGPFLCCKHAIPAIARAGGGAVVITASELALVGSPENPAYCAAKAGLIGMARAMALDHAEQGVRVNCVCPGATDTPMLRRGIENAPDPAEDEADMIRRMPLGRLGQAEEIARAVLFQASDDASFVTGTALVVDGGWTAR